MDTEYKNKPTKRDNTASKQKTEHVIRTQPSTSKMRLPHKEGTKVNTETPALRKKGQKKPASLPDPEKPGGKDDGAGCKWYLRYLNQGFAPEEARKKAEEHKTAPAAPKRKRNEITEEARKKAEEHKTAPAAPKRKRKEITPTQGPGKKRKEGGGKHTTSTSTGGSYAMAVKREKIAILPKAFPGKHTTSTSTGGSYAMAVKREKIAILPKAFPETTLSADEQAAVEEAIMEEMFDGWEHKIQFAGIHFRPGLILVECESPHSAECLRLEVPVLKNWKGVQLTTCKGENIPKSHTATLFLHRSQGQTPEKRLALIQAQNEGLRTKVWNVLSLKDEGKGRRSKGYTIHYRFGSVPVNGLRKQEKEKREDPTPSTSKDGKPGSDAESTSSICISDLYREELASEPMEVEELGEDASEGDSTLTDTGEGDETLIGKDDFLTEN
ncbi:protein of unknown function (DUF4780) [Popillia japonica]|uniref:DUF4780 domain-containing protein n=1 Tax=Popillia japonica TaxID=7064 RepID=A0AAW1L8D1_POPJA